MSTGEPLSVTMEANIVSATEAFGTIEIVSLDGWSCSTTFKDGEQTGVRQSHPLECSNGARGTIILTWDQIQSPWNGAFKLNNGRSGRIVFDLKR